MIVNSIKALVGGVSYTIFYRKAIFKAILIPLILYLLLNSLASLPGTNSEGFRAIGFLMMIPYTLIAITTHRIILQGPGSVSEWGINDFRLREIRYAGYGYLVVLVSLVPSVGFMLIPDVGRYITLLIASYFAGRLSLVFPSIALDTSMGLTESWVETKGRGLVMFVFVVIYPFIVYLLSDLLWYLPGLFWLDLVLNGLAPVFLVASLSVAYKIILGDNV
jgi:hypothetical protein